MSAASSYPTRRAPWRYRRCPNCRQVFAAGQLIYLDEGPAWQYGGSLRRRPECGFEGRTADFPVVRERRAARKGRS